MVQSAPNESTVRGTVRRTRPDPVRPGWVLLDVHLDDAAATEGDELAALASDSDVRLSVRALDAEGLGEGEHFVASVRMAGPGEYLAKEFGPAPTPELGADAGPEVRGRRRERRSPSPGPRPSEGP